MLEVCTTCFDGDWAAMQEFARNHDSDNKAVLGLSFRQIIGTRNRTAFWRDVAAREAPASSAENVVDGDSIDGISRAIKRCCDGFPTVVTIKGKIIGKLAPHNEDQCWRD
jgi:hypothetical protein